VKRSKLSEEGNKMKRIPRVKVLVVLYRKHLCDALTINSLMKVEGADKVSLHIRDNSEERHLSDLDLSEVRSHFHDIVMDWDGVNKSLSVIYNDVTEQMANCKWLVLLDDDTEVPKNFITSLAEADLHDIGADIALPIARCGDLIVSPGYYGFVKGKHWTQVQRGVLSSTNIVAISSGMAIKRSYLAEFPRPFDERLNFYGIDTRFCLDYRKRRSSVFVTSATLEHDSALWKPQDAEERIRRFKSLRRSWRIIHADNIVERTAVITLGILVSVKRAITYRDARYLV
jgi:hypothetical protein